MNWRGKPLVSLAAIVSLIAATRSTTGLRVRSELDRRRYPSGIMEQIHVTPHRFHGDWNHTIRARGRR